MGDPAKQLQSSSLSTDLKALFSVLKTRKTKIFVYGFMFAFIACTAFLAFNPSGNAYPWFKFNNPFTFASSSTSTSSISTYRSQFSSLFSYIFPNSSLASSLGDSVSEIMVDDGVKDGILVENGSDSVVGIGKGGALAGGKQSGNRDTEKSGVLGGNRTEKGALAKDPGKNSVVARKGGALESENQTGSGVAKQGNEVSVKNQTGNGVLDKNQVKQTSEANPNGVLEAKNNIPSGVSEKNGTEIGVPVSKNSRNAKKEIRVQSQGNVALLKNETTPKKKGISGEAAVANLSASLNGDRSSASSSNGNAGRKEEDWIKSLIGCDIFHGRWVKDESYPLYPPGSCPHIDEPFNCHLNGRPDNAYEKLRWQPNGCKLPRLNASDMLERLRGKRLVFVGDSLNRNMWESLVCILKHSVKDKSKVFEQSGRHEFRTEGSYSFLFRDYGCTIEFFRSPFLVQEWEMPDDHGHKKETLRLDIIERSSSKYKDAHVIVFNTGHWWTHEKTSKGKDYYQEGNHVYGNLNVVEAFHKALSTWAKWVDNNVNLKKTLVFFRGYSASHFRGGQWNSGGACDRETEPIKNETYLSSYPPKMNVLESVLKGMKTPVSYLNITRMTDYRKDAHPSVYRKQNLTEEERRSPERYQDCSHWCLPGVPDSWNEILYAQLLIKQYQQQLH